MKKSEKIYSGKTGICVDKLLSKETQGCRNQKPEPVKLVFAFCTSMNSRGSGEILGDLGVRYQANLDRG